jgi:hypothetical protein
LHFHLSLTFYSTLFSIRQDRKQTLKRTIQSKKTKNHTIKTPKQCDANTFLLLHHHTLKTNNFSKPKSDDECLETGYTAQISKANAGEEWTPEAQAAYKLLIECGDFLKATSPISPTTAERMSRSPNACGKCIGHVLFIFCSFLPFFFPTCSPESQLSNMYIHAKKQFTSSQNYMRKQKNQPKITHFTLFF